MILGIDVSHYDETVDWALLKKNGVEFAIAKVSQGDYQRDPSAPKHLYGAHNAGLVCGVYHWCDPIRPDEAQTSFFLECLHQLPYQFICLDVEQYWSDWSGWPAQPIRPRKRKSLKKPVRQPYRLNPFRISQNARTVASLIRKELPEKPLVIYTRTSFVEEYARPMTGWLGEYPLWLAQYPLWRDLPVASNWSDLLERACVPYKLRLPGGCSAWHFWQCSGDRFLLPGISSRPDVNIFKGSQADLQAFIHTPQNSLQEVENASARD
jgi:GH25 family lysozyme M1 (1,4-beta-N-acetylmuramidase)